VIGRIGLEKRPVIGFVGIAIFRRSSSRRRAAWNSGAYRSAESCRTRRQTAQGSAPTCLWGPRKIAAAGNRRHLWREQHRIEPRTKRNRWWANLGCLPSDDHFSRSPCDENSAVRSAFRGDPSGLGGAPFHQVGRHGSKIVMRQPLAGPATRFMPTCSKLAAAANVCDYAGAGALQPQLADGGVVVGQARNAEAAVSREVNGGIAGLCQPQDGAA